MFRATLRRVALLLAFLLCFVAAPQPARAEETNPLPAAVTAQTPATQPPADAPSAGVPVLNVPEGFAVQGQGWVRFAYPPGTAPRLQKLFSEAEAMRAELRNRLGQEVLARVEVRVARNAKEMATLAPPGVPYPKYASGVAYSDIGLVLLTLEPLYPSDNHNLSEVFKHELAHVALHDAVAGRAVPRWFNEGFAVLASGESSFTRLQSLWTATVAGRLLPLPEIERTFPDDETQASTAYAQAVDLVRHLVRNQDAHRFRALISGLRNGQPFEAALMQAYGLDLLTLDFEWREEIGKRYTFWPILFSGTFVWVAAIGLFVWGWHRKRKQSQQTLKVWAREEAIEEHLRRRQSQGETVRVIFTQQAAPAPEPEPSVSVATPTTTIPKVEHEGQWHTLH